MDIKTTLECIKSVFKNPRFSIKEGWWFPCPLNGGALL
jgi:hypothetical protein